ncbi:phosphomevalonate kinase [Rhodotorula toruloides]|uniref:Phosphomevalonate kinase n=1 Tax=Rhodotorula toruloides TaxID=5286 RepID=A0A511KEN4_RHOTO|nr:phosphomevalonate kinase [Rhodotorula toruloides]
MPTVVSCPGKVLVAGGYLVLDRQHQGFVSATPSRFYTVIQNAGEPGAGVERFSITVVSPQFVDGRWEYEARKEADEWVVDALGREESSGNTFVHLSVQAALQVASALNPSATLGSLEVTIVGSNDFYSQSRSDSAPVPFSPLNCTIRNVHKTGLGSSAAMVTSLTSSLLLHWTSSPSSSTSASHGRLPNPDDEIIHLLHNLAQYVHSLAQGKVGSGFDVSAAVYGSQTYRRFAVECLGDLLDPQAKGGSKIASKDLLSILSPTLNPAWTAPSTAGAVTSFSLPPHTLLLLADVDAGSNTPSMVGKVMQWKKAAPKEAERVWSELGRSNEALRNVFAELSEAAKKDTSGYEREVARLAGLSAKEASWSSSTVPFAAAAQRILNIRALMRYMGEQSGVPIEPPEQTKLLDACSALPGVIGAGVPGAGGYDAIWVLCLDPPSESASNPPASAVESLLFSYTNMSVRPLSQSAWVRGGTFEGEAGLLRERVEEIVGLKEAIERGRKR